MSAYDVKEICSGGWLLYEREEQVCIYLVCGSERAALIDAGMGTGDLLAEAAALTPLPILPLLTHAHPDHFIGVLNCPRVWLDEKDHGLMKYYVKLCAEEEGIPVPPLPELLPLPASLDLGGRTLTTVNLQGHTQGSVGFLLEDEKILFSGDGLIYNVWMQLDESSSLADYRKTLEALRPLRSQFDSLWTGHGPEALPAEHLENVINLVDKILEKPFGTPNPPDEPPGFRADGIGCQITYRKDNMGTNIYGKEEIL